MEYCNVYNEGALFAYSGIEGKSLYSFDFVGTLIKEKIGLKFHSEVPIILYNNHLASCVNFKVVSSDYIEYEYLDKRYVFLYLKAGVIVGISKDIDIETKGKSLEENNISIYKLKSGIASLYKDNERFVFAYGRNKKETLSLIKENLNFKIDELIEKKKNYLKEVIENNFNHENLACKCLSVMKTQIYSPEGVYTSLWTTPDRLPHKKMWLWDSVYHSIGFRHIDVSLAQEIIEALFFHQRKDGFIPHMMTPFNASKKTQPPIIMYGALKVFEKSQDRSFIKRVYEHNKQFLTWIDKNRRVSKLYLYSWNTTLIKTCRCDESGMDNSSRFDTKKRLYALDFSCFMANETRLMSQVAKMLDLKEEGVFYETWYQKIVYDINKYMYDTEKGFYFDVYVDSLEKHEVYSVVSFLPLFSHVISIDIATKIVRYLNDEAYFKTDFMIPTIALKDATFELDMWRGPVWINYNYMIIDGLNEYGFFELARKIKEKTIEVVNDVYLKTGVIFEFYDSFNKALPMDLNRKGKTNVNYEFNKKMQTIRDYGWSTTLMFDMLYKGEIK